MNVFCVGNGCAAPCDSTAFDRKEAEKVLRIHRMTPGYAQTPMVGLRDLARRGGVKAVLVKDESKRFGLKAFKGLGGICAMFRILCRELGLDPAETTLDTLRSGPRAEQIKKMVFITTTDGNHGKGVSWAAGIFGCRALVYMPRGSAEARAQAIREAGNAEVEITGLRYDDCVVMTRGLAEKNGWYLIQDTSWEGYEQVPLWIMQGYLTMVTEAAEQLSAMGYTAPTHLFLQAGVGSMAGAVAAAAVNRWPDRRPVISVVEPETVACFYESFLRGDGKPHQAQGSCETIMAGLNCAVPCTLGWEQLRAHASCAFAVSDEVTRLGMRLLARERVVSGESGAVTTGLTAFLLMTEEGRPLKDKLGINEESVILCLNTEGDTDPENYRAIITNGCADPLFMI